ncbi:MAG: amidohydrolase family protein [Litoreibacter sp.]
MRIDAHQHFWKISRGDYDWLTPDITSLYRDFGPDDLAPLLHAQGVDGTILVQAAPTLAETHYLLSLVETCDFVKGVVGWVDFDDVNSPQMITTVAKHSKLVGLRPMIQDISDPDWMLQDQLAQAYSAMIENDLVFDALTKPIHLSNLVELGKRHPKLSVVIDHASKPQIADGQFDDWAEDITKIANETSMYVKLSGLVTEAGPNWNIDKLRPYVAHLLAEVGHSRLIWGSDWPVCTMACSYAHWCDTVDTLLADLNSDEKSAIFGGNAAKLYGVT